MINRVQLLGNLGKNAEERQVGESTVGKFSIATTESWKDKKTQEWVNKTTWHYVEQFNMRNIERLVKGAKVYVEGSIKVDEYTDKEGNAKTSTKILARTIKLLDKKDPSPVLTNNGHDEVPF